MANASFHAAFQDTADNEFDLEITEFREGLGSGEPAEALPSPILVLSRYSALIETVRKAAPRGVPVVQAPDLDQAAEKMPSLKPGVLVADTASIADVADMMAQLTAHFPDLVVIVAGQREDSAALMRLNASAQIFRFLPVPLSHGQTRVMLEAAIAQHKQLLAERRKLSAPPPRIEERRAPDKSRKKSANQSQVRIYVVAAAAGAALAVLLAGAWWLGSRMTREPDVRVAEPATTAPTQAAITAAPTTSAPTDWPDPVEVDLGRAREALAGGRYIEPAGDSALDYYRAVLLADPNNTAAQDGIRNLAADALERAGSALTDGTIEDAVKAVETARQIDPEHPRLAFVSAMVERERFKQAQAQGKSRTIETPPIAKLPELTSPSQLESPGPESTSPAPPSAKAASSQSPSPNPTVAQLPIKSLAPNPAVAQLPVEPLAKVPPPPAPKAKAAKDAGNKELVALVANVRALLSEGKLIDPAGDNAKDALAALRAKDPGRAELNELANTLSGRLLESAKEALAAKAFARSQQLLTAARDVGAPGNEAAIGQVESELTEARRNATAASNAIVAASSLRIIKMVEPVYPAAARRRNEKGSVELLFTVNPEGGVDNVEVRKSNPALVFDDAAKKAVAQWRFEPVLVDGQAISQRAVVRLQFAMD